MLNEKLGWWWIDGVRLLTQQPDVEHFHFTRRLRWMILWLPLETGHTHRENGIAGRHTTLELVAFSYISACVWVCVCKVIFPLCYYWMLAHNADLVLLHPKPLNSWTWHVAEPLTHYTVWHAAMDTLTKSTAMKSADEIEDSRSGHVLETESWFTSTNCKVMTRTVQV